MNTVANIHNELSTAEVEVLAKTMTGLTHSHIFVPKTLFKDGEGVSVSFSEEYPERFLISDIAAGSNCQLQLPHNIEIGMNSATLKAQFGDAYTETLFEDYDDSLQGTVKLDRLNIELLLENDAVTFVEYEVSES